MKNLVLEKTIIFINVHYYHTYLILFNKSRHFLTDFICFLINNSKQAFDGDFLGHRVNVAHCRVTCTDDALVL